MWAEIGDGSTETHLSKKQTSLPRFFTPEQNGSDVPSPKADPALGTFRDRPQFVLRFPQQREISPSVRPSVRPLKHRLPHATAIIERERARRETQRGDGGRGAVACLCEHT